MNKRGAVQFTLQNFIEIFLAVTIILVVGFAFAPHINKWLNPQPTPAQEDLDQVITQLQNLKSFDYLPVRAKGTDYTIVFYPPKSEAMPKKDCSKENFCLCVVEHDKEDKTKCKKLEWLTDNCNKGTLCYSTNKEIAFKVEKNPKTLPEIPICSVHKIISLGDDCLKREFLG